MQLDISADISSNNNHLPSHEKNIIKKNIFHILTKTIHSYFTINISLFIIIHSFIVPVVISSFDLHYCSRLLFYHITSSPLQYLICKSLNSIFLKLYHPFVDLESYRLRSESLYNLQNLFYPLTGINICVSILALHLTYVYIINDM